MAGTDTFTVDQQIFKASFPAITVKHVASTDVSSALAQFLLTLGENNVIGLAPLYGKKCCLTSLAVASATEVLIFKMISSPGCSSQKKSQPSSALINESLRALLADPSLGKYAFRMDRLSASIYYDLRVHISNGKDVLSVATSARLSQDSYLSSLGGREKLDSAAVAKLFCGQESEARTNFPTMALQAWAAYRSAIDANMARRHAVVPPINSMSLKPEILLLVATTIRNGDRCEGLKPLTVRHEAEGKYNRKSGQLEAKSERYSTRIMRPSEGQFMQIVVKQPNGKSKTIRGRTVQVQGKTSKLEVKQDMSKATIKSIHTIGKEKATAAETLRSAAMLTILQVNVDLANNDFVQRIWFPKKRGKRTGSTSLLSTTPAPAPVLTSAFRPLNPSQTNALKAVLSNDHSRKVVLIHGPPGTGKTTVIAACVSSIMSSHDSNATVWLVAQSNVAVKNIAEKLASVDFLDFKILVSKDFHFDWHEHLYHQIEPNLIRSDEFVDDNTAAARLLLGSRVILCTLSTLSNNMIAAMTRLVPLQTVIFDEASQIELGDYFPVLLRFEKSLSKLVFIGDDKQLAPYGSADIDSLGSVFELKHLRENAILLDTQYRMPIPLGSFISENVYKGLLKSQHPISDPLSCRFVDVADSKEVSKGHSWQNTYEIAVAIAIAKQLVAGNKSYRIITPYDAQRSALETALKTAELPWEDKCFNIDAFQGNEDDYIVVSVVRTEKLGFLVDQRRVNVMLTRCKKGLIVCTSRSFMEGPAKETLIGKLAKSIGSATWTSGRAVQYEGVRPFC